MWRFFLVLLVCVQTLAFDDLFPNFRLLESLDQILSQTKIEKKEINFKRQVQHRFVGRKRMNQGQDGKYLSRWLKRSCFPNVAVYMLKSKRIKSLSINKVVDVNVRWMIIGEKLPINSRKTVIFDNVDRLDDVEVILVSDPVDLQKVLFNSVSHAMIINFNSVMQKIRYYENCHGLTERLHDLQQCGIRTLFVEMPVSNDVKNRSKWEHFLNEKKWEIYKHHFRNDNVKIPGLEDKYKYELFTQGRLFDGGQIQCKNYYVKVDYRSKYVNIINHIRPAVGIQPGAVHNIHLVGDSTVQGVCVMDEDTVGSFLQKKINELEQGLYSCLTYGVYDGRPIGLHHIGFRLCDIAVNRGDIVVIVHQRIGSLELKKLCEENGVQHCELQACFERPHDMGEVFMDLRHLNPTGNRKVAEILYETLFVFYRKPTISEEFKHQFCDKMLSTKSENLEWNINTNPAFFSFLRNLWKYKSTPKTCGVIVMNCNPFTLGHLYLVDYAAAQVDRLLIFVVEENRSEFPFADRFCFVKLNTAHSLNVKVMSSGQFIVSAVTLPEYFIKDENPYVHIDASLDLALFCKGIAHVLGVKVRFVGEEPFDKVTLQYNNAMREMLPRFGLKLDIIPRKGFDGHPISASLVRTLLKNGNFSQITHTVPMFTLAYIKRKYVCLEHDLYHC